MNRKVMLSLLPMALLAMAAVANAQQIFDPTQITLRHDFETDPPNAPPPGPFTLGSVTFSESSTGSGGPGWRLISVWAGFGRQLTDNAGISKITLAFNTPMFKVGMDVGIFGNSGRYDVAFMNGNTVVGTVSGTGSGVDSHFFAGWMSGGGITGVIITEPSGENGLVGGIDNVRYDVVPEPATMIALGAGIAGLIARRRRK